MDLEHLEALIRDHGLWEHRDKILASARPAIFMRLGEPGGGRTGASRIGGVPDLPASLPWPNEPSGPRRAGFLRRVLPWPSQPSGARKLRFLLQINFADLPAFPGTPLPTRGMLYLFTGEGGTGPEQVVVYTGNEPLQPRHPSAGEAFATDWYDDLAPHTLAFALSPDIPRWATEDYDALCESVGLHDEDADEDDERLDELARALSAQSVGKLLGHVSGIGHDPREDAYVVREVNPDWLHDYAKRRTLDMSRAARWHNLLEVDSSDEVNLMLGDAGYLQVLVHEDDLRRQEFSRVYVNLQSS